MKLKDELARMPKRRPIRIGTTCGSGYVFVGPRNQVDFEEMDEQYNVYSDYVPFADRQVVDRYPSTINSDFILIVDGTEHCGDYELEIPPLEEIDQSGAERLVNAIYRLAVTDLKEAHIQAKKYRDPFITAAQNANRLEKFIREDLYGALEDPEALIDGVRREVYGDRKC